MRSVTASTGSRLRGAVALAAAGAVAAFAGLAGVAGSAAPAAADPASACAGTKGVIVVVAFDQLGGGTTKGCSTGASTAAAMFADAGYPLTYASSSEGFVCRVAGKPASDPCVNAAPPSAYWSLWTADGKGGGWTYATRGAQGLRPAAGSYVAFAWHEGAGKAAPPDVKPSARVAAAAGSGSTSGSGAAGSGSGTSKGTRPTTPPRSASPSASPSVAPTSAAPSSASASSAAPSASSAPSSASPSAAAAPTAASDEPTASIDDLEEVDPAAAAPADDGGGLPLWAGLLAGAVVLAGAIAVPLLRRRAG